MPVSGIPARRRAPRLGLSGLAQHRFPNENACPSLPESQVHRGFTAVRVPSPYTSSILTAAPSHQLHSPDGKSASGGDALDQGGPASPPAWWLLPHHVSAPRAGGPHPSLQTVVPLWLSGNLTEVQFTQKSMCFKHPD